MKKKNKIFNILFWVNILFVMFVIGVLVLMYKYKNTCGIALPIDELDEICRNNSLMVYYGKHYSFINSVFYVSVFISLVLTIVLTIWNITIKNIKKVIVLVLILISLIGLCLYHQRKIEINEWTAITSDRN